MTAAKNKKKKAKAKAKRANAQAEATAASNATAGAEMPGADAPLPEDDARLAEQGDPNAESDESDNEREPFELAYSAAPLKLSADPEQAKRETDVRALLGRYLRATIVDGRVYEGRFHALDNQCNVILSEAAQLKRCSGNSRTKL